MALVARSSQVTSLEHLPSHARWNTRDHEGIRSGASYPLRVILRLPREWSFSSPIPSLGFRFHTPIPLNMRTLHLLVLLLLLAVPRHTIAQSAQQLTLDTPGQYPGQDSVIAWVVTPSGARILVTPGGTDGFMIRRYDTNGQPVWSKRIAHPAFDFQFNGNQPHIAWINGTPFHSDQAEGLLFACTGGGIWSADGLGLDTLMLGTFVVRLDQNGDQVFAFVVRNPVIGTPNSFPGIDHLMNAEITVQPDGSFHLINQKTGTLNQVLQIQRYDASGNNQWTRLYYEPGGSITNGPAVDEETHGWIPDGLGGLYIANAWDQNYMHLDPSGTCDWAFQYRINGISGALGSTLDPVTNDLLLLGKLYSAVTNKTTIMRIAPTGSLLASDAYDMGLLDQAIWAGGDVHIRPNGGPVTTAAHVSGYPFRNSVFLLVDPLGSAHKRYLKEAALVQGEYIQHHWSESALVGDVLHLRGHVQRVDSIFGIETWKPAIAAIALGSVNACLLSDTVVSYNDAMGISTVIADTAWLSVEADSMTIVQQTLTITTVPNIPTLDFCSTILGLSDPVASSTINVLSNLVSFGDPIILLNAEPGELTVFDADGRRVAGGLRTTRQKSFELSTQGWANGMKLVHWRSSDGVRQRTMKVVLE